MSLSLFPDLTTGRTEDPTVALINASGMTDEDKQRVIDLFAEINRDNRLKRECFEQLAADNNIPADQRALLFAFFGHGFDYCRPLQRSQSDHDA